jgi:leucyl/phenylalanyl-tRNA--protein transferase
VTTELRWLSADAGPESLPDPENALAEPNGLLAAGGSLNPEWLLASYRRGIFPWFEARQPILWWSPDPRSVLDPAKLRVSRSLGKRMRQGRFGVRADTDFASVIAGCAAPRRYTSATWITPAMREAYIALHRLGWAHSFEAWSGETLVGGLYGVAIGRVFFGESMFARETDASKVAFAHAGRYLVAEGVELIDCQLPTAHLEQFGAAGMPRREFLARLRDLTEPPGKPGSWAGSFAARLAEFLV